MARKPRVTKVTMSLGPKAYSFLARDKGGEIWMWSYESEVLLSPAVATPVAGAVQGAAATLEWISLLSLCNIAKWFHCLSLNFLVSKIR